MDYLAEFKSTFRKSKIGLMLINTYGIKAIFETENDVFTNNITCLAYEMFVEKGHFENINFPKTVSDNRKYKFLNAAKAKHGDKFDYDNVKFDGDYVELYCNDHKGVIRTTRWYHLNSTACGCKICYVNSKRYNIDNLKEELSYIWQNEYNYELFDSYTNALAQIPISCRHHGVFSLTPTEHKNTRVIGCGNCYRDPLHKQHYLKLCKEARRRQIDWKEGKR